MSRIIVVSNRLPTARADSATGNLNMPAGGLASALHAALRNSPDSVWFGWNGRTVEPARAGKLTFSTADGIQLVGLSLTPAELTGYYQGYCNETLWPLLHCFQGRVRVRPDSEQCYRAVQRRFAAALHPLLRQGDQLWIHDYHLMPLGAELRRMGWEGRIGFFLHTPFPPREMWEILLDPRGMLQAMQAYDLVGLHVEPFRHNYVHCCRVLLGSSYSDGVLWTRGHPQRVGVYPVGIEPEAFQPNTARPARRRREVLHAVLRQRRLILGVDRLDYTKGIVQRFVSYETFLREHPRWRRRVIYVQVASPSRAEVAEYEDQKLRIEALIGRVNGEWGEHDWQPMRYLYRNYPRRFLAKLYREADVGLVTPLRDGMNLVAKEYVAAQYPDSPGVLVLSRSAGAAHELDAAILVDPFVPCDVAAGIQRALAMPVAERRERHAALLKRICEHTAAWWGEHFLADLRRTLRVAPPLTRVGWAARPVGA